MTTVTFTSVPSGGRWSVYRPDPFPTDYFYVFTAQPSSVTIHNTGAVDAHVWIDRGNAAKAYIANVGNQILAAGASTTFAWPPTDANYASIAFNCEDSSVTQHLTMIYAGLPDTLCAYGVESNPDATLYQIVTDSLIDLVVAGVLAGTANAEWIPFVETALAAVEGSVFVGVNCSTLPEGNTNLDLTNPGTYSLPNLQSWFQRAAWHTFCQCVPASGGDPAPVTPDPPTITPPTGVSPTQPAFTCDESDLCTYLSSMKAEIEQILAQLAIVRSNVQLIQRQKAPFGYIPGTTHPGVTGDGQFAVQGILAVSVQLTTIPGRAGEIAGDPVARFDIGYVTSATADGWRRSVPLRHNPQWVDVEPDDTLIGYSLTPGVVANIIEMRREP